MLIHCITLRNEVLGGKIFSILYPSEMGNFFSWWKLNSLPIFINNEWRSSLTSLTIQVTDSHVFLKNFVVHQVITTHLIIFSQWQPSVMKEIFSYHWKLFISLRLLLIFGVWYNVSTLPTQSVMEGTQSEGARTAIVQKVLELCYFFITDLYTYTIELSFWLLFSY